MSLSLDNHLDLQALVEMGFTKERVEQALAATKHQGIQPAIEWLFSHPVADANSGQRLGNTETTANPQTDETTATTNATTVPGDTSTIENTLKEDKTESVESEAVGGTALSLVCEDCGKQLRSDADVQAHAVRTGHQNFAESKEEIKPLTAEEKEEQRQRLQQKLEERRQLRLNEEKNQEREREKSRRKTGQEISKAKEDYAQQELKRIAEERRREKLEEKRLRQKLKEQIAKDRENLKAKHQAENPTTKSTSPTVVATQSTTVPVKKEYDTCRLQFRLTDGSTLSSTFKATDTLASVYSYLESNKKDSLPYTLATTFPRKVFQQNDNTKTLKELGLVPSSVLVLGK